MTAILSLYFSMYVRKQEVKHNGPILVVVFRIVPPQGKPFLNYFKKDFNLFGMFVHDQRPRLGLACGFRFKYYVRTCGRVRVFE